MEKNLKYKIRVKTLEGRLLTFHNVEQFHNNYGLISFIDSKTGETKNFSSSNCEIEEERE
jgi:hypothetical protein